MAIAASAIINTHPTPRPASPDTIPNQKKTNVRSANTNRVRRSSHAGGCCPRIIQASYPPRKKKPPLRTAFDRIVRYTSQCGPSLQSAGRRWQGKRNRLHRQLYGNSNNYGPNRLDSCSCTAEPRPSALRLRLEERTQRKRPTNKMCDPRIMPDKLPCDSVYKSLQILPPRSRAVCHPGF